jgi:hypothetical protein
MNVINSKLHGVLDYASAFILLLPWITDFYPDSTDTMVLALVGAATVAYSLFTDYELGVIKVLPMKFHLALDVLNALLMIALPWLFPVHHYLFYWPVLFGCAELLIIVLSSPVAYQSRRRDVSRIDGP